MTFLTILGVTEILCTFKSVLEGKTSIEIPELSRLEFLVLKFSVNNFALSDADDKCKFFGILENSLLGNRINFLNSWDTS